MPENESVPVAPVRSPDAPPAPTGGGSAPAAPEARTPGAPASPDANAGNPAVRNRNEPQSDENGVYTANVINRQADVEKRIRKEAQDQVREAQREGKAWDPRTWPRKLRLKFGEDYYTQRGIKLLRDAAIENNNVFVDLDIVKKEASLVKKGWNKVRGKPAPGPVDRNRNLTRDERAHKSEARAKLEQISLGHPIEGDNVKEAAGPLKDLMIEEVFKPMFNHAGPMGEKDVQKLLRDFVERHENHADANVKNALNEMFGQGATDFNERAKIFASDFGEVVEALKRDSQAHGFGVDAINNKIKINMATTEWAASTDLKLSKADQWATRLKARKSGALFFNEPTIGALTSIGAFVAWRGARSALGAVAFGTGAGAVMGYMERRRNLNKDVRIHRSDTEYGRNVDMASRGDDWRSKTADKLDMRKKLESFRYQEMASVNDILRSDEDRPGLGDSRSLRTLMQLDLEGVTPAHENNRRLLAARVAEIQERLRFSSEQGAGMIQFESKTKVEHGRLELVKGLVEGKKALVDALVASGVSEADARNQINTMVQASTDQWKQRFTADRDAQDKSFKHYRNMSALRMGAFGGAAAFATSLLTQQGIAEIGAHPLDNRPVNPTLLEKFDNSSIGPDVLHDHGIKHLDAVKGLQEALSQNRIADVVGPLKTLGFDVSLDNKGQIVIDAINGQAINGPHPMLSYDAATGSMNFAGPISPEARQILDENYFSVGETKLGTEAMAAAPAPQDVVIPGSNNLHASIPGGTELRPDGNGFALFSKDATPVKLADGLQFDSSGHLTSHNILEPTKVQLDVPKPGPDHSVSTNEWLKQYDSGKGIDQWYGNNTRESNLNELRAYNYPTPGKEDSVTFDMGRMKQASWQTGNVPYSFDVQQELKANNGAMALWNKGNPDKIDMLIKVPADGKVTFDWDAQGTMDVYTVKDGWKPIPASEVSKMFMAHEIPADFKGASEVNPEFRKLFNKNYSMGVFKDGEFSSFATGFGRGMPPEMIGAPSEITTFSPVPGTEIKLPEGWEPMPIALPITPRRHLGDTTRGYDIYPGGYYGYHGSEPGGEGFGLLPREAYADRRSPRLRNNPEGALNEQQEVEQYISSWSPEYRAELESFNNSINTPMSEECRAVVTIPAYGEGNNIRTTLEQYLNQQTKSGQSLNSKAFEIVVVDNHPSSVAKDSTEDEIRAFMQEHPELQVSYAHKEWTEDDTAGVGNARKYATDLALLRSSKRSSQNGDLILISGDADVEAVSPRYIDDYVRRFDSDKKIDAASGRWDLPESALANPNMRAAERFWYFLDRVIAHDAVGDPKSRERRASGLVGRNAAIRASTFAAIGGYNPEATLAEDLEIGWMISDARKGDPDRFTYVGSSQVVSKARRFLAAMSQGVPLIQMYGGFHENTEVRKMDENQLLQKIPKDFSREKLQKELDAFWQAGEKGQYKYLGDKFPDLFERATGFLGVEYKIEDGHVVLTNTQKLEEGLAKHAGRNSIDQPRSPQNGEDADSPGLGQRVKAMARRGLSRVQAGRSGPTPGQQQPNEQEQPAGDTAESTPREGVLQRARQSVGERLDRLEAEQQARAEDWGQDHGQPSSPSQSANGGEGTPREGVLQRVRQAAGERWENLQAEQQARVGNWGGQVESPETPEPGDDAGRSPLRDRVQGAAQSAGNVARQGARVVGGAASQGLDKGVAAAQSVGKVAGEAAGAVSSAVKKGAGAVRDVANDAASPAAQRFSDRMESEVVDSDRAVTPGQAARAVGNVVKQGGNAVGSAAKGAGNLAGKAAGAAGSVGKRSWDVAGSAAKGAGNLAGKAAGAVGNAAQKGVQGAGQAVGKGAEFARDAGGRVLDDVRAEEQRYRKEQLKDDAERDARNADKTPMGERLQNAAQVGWDVAKQGGNAVGSVAKGAGNVAGKAAGAAGSIAGAAARGVGKGYDRAKELDERAVEWSEEKQELVGAAVRQGVSVAKEIRKRAAERKAAEEQSNKEPEVQGNDQDADKDAGAKEPKPQPLQGPELEADAPVIDPPVDSTPQDPQQAEEPADARKGFIGRVLDEVKAELPAAQQRKAEQERLQDRNAEQVISPDDEAAIPPRLDQQDDARRGEFWRNFRKGADNAGGSGETETPPVRLDAEHTINFPVITKVKDTTTVGYTIGAPEVGTAVIRELDIDTTEREAVLRNTSIRGDEFTMQQGTRPDGTPIYGERKLKMKDLREAGLGPEYRVDLDNRFMLLSKPYTVQEGRTAFIAYVRGDNGSYAARTFYLSNSQGVWRYLPSYLPDGKGGVNWYDKGFSEESINAPIPLQEAMDTILSQNDPIKPPGNPYFYFAGTARSIRNRKDATYLFEVGAKPAELPGRFKDAEQRFTDKVQKLPPEEIGFANKEDAPDVWAPPLHSWVDTKGRVNEVFESGNKKYKYLIVKDGDRVMFGGAEDTSDVTSIGVRKNWLQLGDLATPINEYYSQIGRDEYANFGMAGSTYVDMYKNYISRIPIIKEYNEALATRSQRLESPQPPTSLDSDQAVDAGSQSVDASESDKKNSEVQKAVEKLIAEFPPPSILEADEQELPDPDVAREARRKLTKQRRDVLEGVTSELPEEVLSVESVIKDEWRDRSNNRVQALERIAESVQDQPIERLRLMHGLQELSSRDQEEFEEMLDMPTLRTFIDVPDSVDNDIDEWSSATMEKIKAETGMRLDIEPARNMLKAVYEGIGSEIRRNGGNDLDDDEVVRLAKAFIGDVAEYNKQSIIDNLFYDQIAKNAESQTDDK